MLDDDYELLCGLLLAVYREHLDDGGDYAHPWGRCRVCRFLQKHQRDLDAVLPWDAAKWRSRQDEMEVLETLHYGPITEAQHKQRELMRKILEPYDRLLTEQLRSQPIFASLSTRTPGDGDTVTFRRVP